MYHIISYTNDAYIVIQVNQTYFRTIIRTFSYKIDFDRLGTAITGSTNPDNTCKATKTSSGSSANVEVTKVLIYLHT